MTEKTPQIWLHICILLSGVFLSMALAGIASQMLQQGVVRLAVSNALLAAGLAATGLVFWHYTRKLAGDERRMGTVSILAFLVVHEREWLEHLGVVGWQMDLARFLMTLVAFGFVMLVYKWLQPIDAREAAQNAGRAGGEQP